MKVAALYDVHGMSHALDAVLTEVEREGFDAVLFGGDLIGGPFPEVVVARARALAGARFVRGNDNGTQGEPRAKRRQNVPGCLPVHPCRWFIEQ